MDTGAVTAAVTAFLVAALPISVLVTKVVDTIRNLVDSRDPNTGDMRIPKVVWNIVAFAVGVAICIGWQFNPVAGLLHVIPAFASDTRLDGVAGQVLSGLAVGAMAGFWHEKLDQWSSAAKESNVEAGMAPGA